MEHKDKSLTGMVPTKEHPSWKQAFEQGKDKRIVRIKEDAATGIALNFWSDGSITWSEVKTGQ